MLGVIRQFHDGMGACVRLDDGECSDMFGVEQGVWQGCVFAPLLFNICSRRCCTCRRNASPLMQSLWTVSGNSKGRRKEEKKSGGHGPEESTSKARRRRPRCCEECCTLTMQALYRDNWKAER